MQQFFSNCFNEHFFFFRDLKPENILLDENMHILITDFGSAKMFNEEQKDSDEEDGSMRSRRNSFVGTAQYVSPELLTDKSASHSSDLWALGCIVYQMVAGLPPFWARSEYLIFQKILKLEYEFPDGFSPSARNLVEKLLVSNNLIFSLLFFFWYTLFNNMTVLNRF